MFCAVYSHARMLACDSYDIRVQCTRTYEIFNEARKRGKPTKTPIFSRFLNKGFFMGIGTLNQTN